MFAVAAPSACGKPSLTGTASPFMGFNIHLLAECKRAFPLTFIGKTKLTTILQTLEL
jgi:hypothetical protein